MRLMKIFTKEGEGYINVNEISSLEARGNKTVLFLNNGSKIEIEEDIKEVVRILWEE